MVWRGRGSWRVTSPPRGAPEPRPQRRARLWRLWDVGGDTNLDMELCHPPQVSPPPPQALNPRNVPGKTRRGRPLCTCCRLGACPVMVAPWPGVRGQAGCPRTARRSVGAPTHGRKLRWLWCSAPSSEGQTCPKKMGIWGAQGS